MRRGPERERVRRAVVKDILAAEANKTGGVMEQKHSNDMR